MPPKATSKVLPPKQRPGESKPLGIKPPTKQQIHAAKNNIRADGGTVVKAADIKNLLNKGVDQEFQDEVALDLTKMQPQFTAQPSLQPHNTEYQEQMQVVQPSNAFMGYQPPSTYAVNPAVTDPQYNSAQGVKQQPVLVEDRPPEYKKKPSEMTRAEYEEYERQRERSNWMRLINICVWRTPSTFEKNELEDSRKRNPEFEELYQRELLKKQQQQPPTNPHNPQEALKPQPKASDHGRFNPSYKPSKDNGTADYQAAYAPQYQSAPQMQIPQILPNMQQFEQNNQIFQQQQSQIMELQKQIQQLTLNNQLNQGNMQVVPITNSANQHLLQSIQDLQVELQLTKQQAGKYQQEIYNLSNEKRVLEQQLHTEQSYRQAAETRVGQMTIDLEALRAQIGDMKEKLERATSQDFQSRAPNQGMEQNGFVRPNIGASYQTSTQIPLTRATDNQPTNVLRQNNPYEQAPQVESHASKREDPNFNSIALNDIDQIMKNANIILNKYQDFDQTYETPAGQQVKEAYTNIMNNQNIPAARGSKQAGRAQNIQEVDRTIEELLKDDGTQMMSTQEMNAAPTDIPSSILEQIPDADELQAANRQQDEGAYQNDEQRQYEQDVRDYNTDNVGSLLPKSKFNSRNQVIRK